MPFKSFLCELSGDPVAPEACLACARSGAPGCEVGSPAIIAGILRRQRPPDFALASAVEERRDLNLDQAFSVTELLGCPRKTRLMAAHDWMQKPSQLYWAYRGCLFHAEAEKYIAEDPLASGETRLFWFLRFAGQNVGLSGQPDLLLFDLALGGWRVLDYKTIKEVPSYTYRYTCPETGKVIYEVPFRIKGRNVNCPWCRDRHPVERVEVVQLPPQPRGSHALQIQFYALLVEKNAAALARRVNAALAAAGRAERIPDDAPIVAGELVYLDMSSQKRMPVAILPRDERLALLKDRLAVHLQADLPAILTDPHELWACDYCPVRAVCATLHGGPVGKDQLQPVEPAESPEKKILAELGY